MWKLIKRIVIFFLILGMVMFSNYLINKTIISNTSNAFNDKISILIAGDSHPMTAINPDVICQSRNIAQTGEPYFMTYFKLKRILEDNPTISKVVLGYSFHNISAFNDLKFKDSFWATQMLDRTYALIPYERFKEIPLNTERYFQTVIRRMLVAPRTDHTKKYVGSFEKKEGMLAQAGLQETIDKHYFNEDKALNISDISVSYLDSIVGLTGKHQIKLYLTGTPLHAAYREQIPEKFIKKYRELTTQYLAFEHVSFIDYSQLNMDGNLYQDYDHLNYKGSLVFSPLINQKINNKCR